VLVIILLGPASAALGILSLGLIVWVIIMLHYVSPKFRWDKTTGTITDSRVVSNRLCNGLPGHHYLVGYEFKVAGHEYRNTTVRLGSFKYYTRAGAEAITRRHRPGDQVTVYYGADFVPQLPDDEPVSLLEPGFNIECLYPICLSVASTGLTVLATTSLILRLIR